MSDIFISYKREEQATARKLANALEGEGWTVWWDPKLRAGERFNDVIEKALKESNCVVVMWSKLSVESQYVKHEANYALRRNKLVPVMIEEVELPFRFEDLHTLSLLGWDGSKDFSEFRRLFEDISAIVGPATKRQEAQPADRQESKLEPGKIFRDKLKGGKGGSTRLPSVKQPKSKLNPGTVFRDKLKDGSQGPEMVVIPAGTFRMGDTNSDGTEVERPVHPVRISRPFAMGRYEVTFEEYDQFAAATGRELPRDEGWGRGRSPVINVSWNEAMDYAEWLSQQTIKPYRLPTEAEWEYAVRAGTETAYWWGNEMKSGMANCNDGSSKWSGKQTAQVGSFKPNPFGMHDMAGNVREWVQDCWHDNYNSAPADSSAWKEEGGGKCGQRVVRGGSWTRTPGHLRSSYRIRFVTDARGYDIGFRLAQDVD
jgi:formylglycine-generating enzyme required for sulfatase activity